MSDQIVALFTPAIAAIFAVVFIALWHRDRERRYVLALAIGYFSLGAGFVVFHYNSAPDHPASIIAMHTLYWLSVVSVCWAVCRRIGERVSLVSFGLIGLLGGAMMVIAGYSADMNARLYAANATYGTITMLTAQILARNAEPNAVNRAIVWLFGLTALQFFFRPMLAIIFETPLGGADYRSSIFYAIVMVTIGLTSLLMALALIAAVLSDHWNAEREAAEYDHLTGLKMRRAFEQAVMRMIDENADRRYPLSMIVADIDHFKRVNDIWGHQAGDAAIASFGELIADTVRAEDVCGRIGGEEFCILVSNCDGKAASGLAERLRKKFGSMGHDAIGDNIRLSASFGVAEWRYGEGYGKLFARADAALYAAKNLGRNRVENDSRKTSDGAVDGAGDGGEAAIAVLHASA